MIDGRDFDEDDGHPSAMIEIIATSKDRNEIDWLSSGFTEDPAKTKLSSPRTGPRTRLSRPKFFVPLDAK